MLSRLASDMAYTIKMMRDMEKYQNQGSAFYQPKRKHKKSKEERINGGKK